VEILAGIPQCCPDGVAAVPLEVPTLEAIPEVASSEAVLPVGDPKILGSSEDRDTMGGNKVGTGGARQTSGRSRLHMLLGVWDAAVAAVIGVPLQSGNVRPAQATWHRCVRNKLWKLGLTRGEDAAIAEMKIFATECRRAWVEHTRPVHWVFRSCPPKLRESQSVWAQLSMLGRALPTGTDRHEAKALLQHQKDLTSPFETAPEDLESIRSFARDWAWRFLPRTVDPADTIGPLTGTSATVETTRSRGGLTADLSELLGSVPPIEAEVPDELPREWDSVLSDIRLVGAALEEVGSALPKGRVTVVRERGHKVRVVTAMSRHALVLGHLSRRRLVKGLRKWP
jgi:hypothetical protein